MKHVKLLIICMIVVSLFCSGCKKESSPPEEQNEAVTSTKGEDVTNFLTIDDFESYNDLEEGEPGSNRIYLSWIDGSDNAGVNGSTVGHSYPPFAEKNIVHGGNQSMPFGYHNYIGKSEATLTLTYPRNWTEYGVRTLSIWFRGYSQNAAETMYVVLNSSAGIDNDNPNAAQVATWTEWNIPLQAFADQGVNLSNVNTITIGFGNRKNPTVGGAGMVYFDDIILYRQPKPKPKTASFALLKAGDVVTNSIGMKLVYIPAGSFMMGSGHSATQLAKEYLEKEEDFVHEFPQHQVRLSEGFLIGQTEVTQSQYKSVMNAQPWSGHRHVRALDNNPAVYVSWEDAAEFCRKLSEREGKTYRLPTEAEWEYACRAGTTTRFSFGDSGSSLSENAWCRSNALDVGQAYAHPVGQKKPNPWGLYDMHGNIFEWCSDWYDEDYYSNSPNVDPKGPLSGDWRSLRGGSFGSVENYLRCAGRFCYHTTGRSVEIGFRIVIVALKKQQSPTVSSSSQDIKSSSQTENSAAQSTYSTPASTTSTAIRQPEQGTVVTNSIGMKLVYIPAGSFMMGSGDSAAQLAREYLQKEEDFAYEFPQHQVRISGGFLMGQTEVTQGQYKSVMNAQPWSGHCDVRALANNPAVYVSWYDADEFCRKLSQKEGKTYRLPTEAEWEYACRAGTTTRFGFGDNDSSLGEYAWYRSNAQNVGQEYAHPVGQKKPNPWGMYDMHGNVCEWCSDWYGWDYYSNSPSVDPKGPSSGSYRSLRGGSWGFYKHEQRCSVRNCFLPDYRFGDLGFRVVCSQP